jgi:nucleotide-binding universal stress UspA family protein
MTSGTESGPALRLPRDRGWLRDRVVVDGDALAMARGCEWAEALGVECVVCRRRAGGPAEGGRLVDVPRSFRPTRLRAELVVVDAAAGHVRWRVRRAVAPLLFVRAPVPSGRIVVAIDLGDASEQALALVAKLVHKRHRPITLVHSIAHGVDEAEWMANFGGSAGDFVSDDADGRRAAATVRLADLLARYDLSGDVRVGDAPVAQLVLRAASELKPDLIAFGAPRHHGLFHLLRRSIVDEVAVAAAASILVVPHRVQEHSPE